MSTKSIVSVKERADMLTISANELAYRHFTQMCLEVNGQPRNLQPQDVLDAAAFGFAMGAIHGAVLHDILDHKELREVIYQVLRDRFKYTDEDIAVDIIGG